MADRNEHCASDADQSCWIEHLDNPEAAIFSALDFFRNAGSANGGTRVFFRIACLEKRTLAPAAVSD